MTEFEPRQQRHGGRILKEAREAQGISLETVHLATKIPMDVLKSIEEGYKVRTITPFYVKGFVKMYAHYLNVDVAKVIEDYHPEQLPTHIPDKRDMPMLEEVVGVIPKEKQKLIAQIIGGVILVLIVFKIGSVIWMAKAHKKEARAPAITVEKKKPRRTQQNVNKTPEDALVERRAAAPKTVAAARLEPVATDEDTGEKKPVAKKVRLTIRAKQSGWLQVKADGNIVFQSTLEEGASESWTAQKTIELSGKNIHNLEFEVNGRVLGGLGREDRSARRVVVTAEGLSVKSTL